MEPSEHPEVYHPPVFEKQKVSFWRKLGGGSLSISLIIHGILLAAGVYIVVQVIPPAEEPPVDFLPKSGGGGAASAPNPSQKVRVNMPQSTASRIAAKGAESAFSLPEPDASSDMNSLSSLDAGSLSGGMGGNGFGGGKGDGQGLGVGDGMGIGIGGVEGTGNPFGAPDAKATGLIGVLYDLKQTNEGKTIDDPKGADPRQVDKTVAREIIGEFNKNWDERAFSKFYKAKQQLKQSRIVMPVMSASLAPQAFKCADEVKPKRWVVLYKGTVVAPKSGKFRFVGVGDDALMVRFNNKIVLDRGYFTLNKFKDIKTKEGIKYGALGKLDLGPGEDFSVQAGSAYPIEILIAEIPGGRFGAMLFVEENGVEYAKTSDGVTILPIFRTTGDLPTGKDLPPIDKNSPIWKIAGQHSINDI